MPLVDVMRGARQIVSAFAHTNSIVPRDPAIDGTFSLIREGYPFIWNRCRALNSDIFTTRIMGKPAVCIHGPEAAQLFYDETKLQRAGAVPRRVVTSLFGKKAVHTLDGEAHKRRKLAFMSLMTEPSLERLTALMAEQWQLAIRRWPNQSSVVLFEESQRILTAAVCEWAGIPIEVDDVPVRAQQLGEMVDAFGGVGPRLWRGKLARFAAERWIMRHVRAVRLGLAVAESGTALDLLTQYRDERGRKLDTHTVAVEILNLIRPTSAIAWYITDAAHALHMFPETRTQLLNDTDDGRYANLFLQEVRRFYPFTPYLGAMVKAPFAWRGHRFKPGTLVLLDVYGASRDPAIWHDPDAFTPERFLEYEPTPYNFIPQGGGSPNHGHRCAGERITLLSLSLALRCLTRDMTYDVEPRQDLTIDLTRMPTRPTSGMILHNVVPTADLELEPARTPEAAYRDYANPIPLS
jgi:fatty-acid peroxygenase